MLLRSLVVIAFVTCACVSGPNAECERATQRSSLVSAPLPRGGWDGNGQQLTGGKLISVASLAEISAGAKLKASVAGEGEAELVVVAADEVTVDGVNPCGAGGKGLFVAGTWDATGARSEGGATFSCAAGAIAKCVAMGYGADPALHQACTRMVRADYCGDGVSYTRNGTAIEPVDAHFIRGASGDASFQFEAAWGPSGATCVSRPRFDTFTQGGDAVLPSCWAALPRCDSWARAAEQGAELGVSSRVQSRLLCD